VEELSIEITGKRVVEELSLEIGTGEVVALTGPNGSGKSSLAKTLLGDTNYRVVKGEVKFLGSDLLKMEVDERARAGLMVLYQNPVVIPGVKVFNLVKTAKEARGEKIEEIVEFKVKLEELAENVGLTNEHIGREVNEGFSGGEKKRLELLQLMLLSPKLAILDEVDSGLDAEGRELVAKIVKEMREKGTSFMVISHYEKMLDLLQVDKSYRMRDGRI
jgi:Fe-S cluster assembly ATP-binding protein